MDLTVQISDLVSSVLYQKERWLSLISSRLPSIKRNHGQEQVSTTPYIQTHQQIARSKVFYKA